MPFLTMHLMKVASSTPAKHTLEITPSNLTVKYNGEVQSVSGYSVEGELDGVPMTGTIMVVSTEDGVTLTYTYDVSELVRVPPSSPPAADSASWSARFSSIGTHYYTLVYSGDENYEECESEPGYVEITRRTVS